MPVLTQIIAVVTCRRCSRVIAPGGRRQEKRSLSSLEEGARSQLQPIPTRSFALTVRKHSTNESAEVRSRLFLSDNVARLPRARDIVNGAEPTRLV